jgi:hypothetical protein
LFGTGQNEQPTGLLTNPAMTIDKAGDYVEPQDLLDLKTFMIDTWRIDDVGTQLRWALNPALYAGCG